MCTECEKVISSGKRNRRVASKEEFIKKAIAVHGGRYDYSKVNYVDTRTKICIICRIHGEFWQLPGNHVWSRGCPACGLLSFSKKVSLTKEEFIAKAIKIHGEGKYNYSKVKYIDWYTKVCITCLIHGDFWQTPAVHFQGKGCRKCGYILRTKNMAERVKKEFINKAIKVHGEGTYDYSKMDFVDNETKICIVCPIHGEFFQTPHSHLRGRKCIKCGYELMAKTHILPFDDFISKAVSIHGNSYDYSKSVYINSHTPICIICKKHGEFQRTPNDLLNGCGCPKCGWENTGEKLVLTAEEFISKAVFVHGKGTYDYSKINYVDVITKVCIICPIHGEFLQVAHSHLQGHGCPNCYKSYGELSIKKWLDENNIGYIQEHVYPDLKGSGKRFLRFDFFIPFLNMVVEFDGGHHFKPVRFSGMSMKKAIDRFKEVQFNDALKNKYCKDNGILLLRIGYKKFKYIPEILSKNIIKYNKAA